MRTDVPRASQPQLHEEPSQRQIWLPECATSGMHACCSCHADMGAAQQVCMLACESLNEISRSPEFLSALATAVRRPCAGRRAAST